MIQRHETHSGLQFLSIFLRSPAAPRPLTARQPRSSRSGSTPFTFVTTARSSPLTSRTPSRKSLLEHTCSLFRAWSNFDRTTLMTINQDYCGPCCGECCAMATERTISVRTRRSSHCTPVFLLPALVTSLPQTPLAPWLIALSWRSSCASGLACSPGRLHRSVCPALQTILLSMLCSTTWRKQRPLLRMSSDLLPGSLGTATSTIHWPWSSTSSLMPFTFGTTARSSALTSRTPPRTITSKRTYSLFVEKVWHAAVAHQILAAHQDCVDLVWLLVIASPITRPTSGVPRGKAVTVKAVTAQNGKPYEAAAVAQILQANVAVLHDNNMCCV